MFMNRSANGPFRLAVIALGVASALTSLRFANAAEWENISRDVFKQLEDQGKPQGDFKHSGGIAVDPKTGDVFMVMCHQGVWKSTNQGRTFQRLDDGKFKGRCETGGAFHVDPQGGRMALVTVYGQSAMISDGGKKIDKFASGHFDYVAVDWNSGGKALLAFRHEANETLTLSRDAGATWTDLGKGFKGFFVGIFDANTLIAGRGDGILRSTDGGKSWKKVSDAKVLSPVVQVRSGAGYLIGEGGLLVTKDQGASWSIQGSPVKGAIGPVFGKDDSHLLVAGNDGVMESVDGGETWKNIAESPPGYPRVAELGRGPTPSLAFDAQRNIIYMSQLGQPAYRLQR